MKKLAWLSLLFLFGCSSTEKETIIEAPDFTGIMTAFESFNSPATSATIGMIGDILLHEPLYTYDDYTDAFAEVKKPLESIDFLLANQESMPSGDLFPYGGYPTFNSPAHIIEGLQNVGVDMVSIANNHTLDRGEKGILAAIANIKSYDMPYVGAYLSEKDQNEVRTTTVNGITFGFLAYTYGTNGIPTPEGKDYLVARIDPERISKEVQEMEELVDVTVVSMHWGNEYELSPHQSQIDLAQVISDAGGDIIFGHHPHVLQKFDTLTGEAGNETHIIYSLGNFYSGQYFPYTDIGGIAQFTVDKGSDGEISVHTPSFYPTAVVIDPKGMYKVVPLETAKPDPTATYEWATDHMKTTP